MRRLFVVLAMLTAAIIVDDAQVASPTRLMILAAPRRNPTVTINQASGQADPTSATPILFTAVFSETVTGFTGSDVVFTGSSAGGVLTALVTGIGATYTVSVSGMTMTGTVIASIPAGAAVNSRGDPNLLSTSTDHTVTWNQPPPPPPTVTWTKQLKNGTWPAYAGYLSILYDPFTQRTIFYLPVSGSTIYSSDILAYTAATNTFERHPDGNATVDESMACSSEKTSPVWPSDRHPEQMAIDTTRHVLWMWAGPCQGLFDGLANTDRIWTFHLNPTLSQATWTKLPVIPFPPGNPAENGGEMIYSSDDDVLFLHGGTNNGFHEDWVFCPVDSGTLTAKQLAAGCDTPNEWSEVCDVPADPCYGTTPPAVAYLGMWYETVTKKAILYGGENLSGTFYNDIWAYDIPTRTWTKKNPANPPPVKTGISDGNPPAMAYDSTLHKFLYRQLTNAGAPKDWQYEPVANTWTPLTSTVGPVPDLPIANFPMTYDEGMHRFIALVYGSTSDPQNHPVVWQGQW